MNKNEHAKKTSLRITIIYVIFAVLWILFSDKLLSIIVDDIEQMQRLQTVKGLLFVAATTVLIYNLVKNSLVKKIEIAEHIIKAQQLDRITKYYQEFVKCLPAAVLVHVDSKIIFCNEKAAKFLGYEKAEELLGKNVLTHVHPDSHDIVKERLEKITKQKAILPIIEEKFISRDGRTITAEVMGMPIDFFGQPSIIAVAHDVTYRKAIEVDLKESRKRYRQLIEFLPYAVIIIQKKKIIFANRSAASLFGTENFRSLYGRNILDFVPLDRHVSAENNFMHVLKSKKALSLSEGFIMKVDKSVRNIEVAMAPIEFINKSDILIVLSDITERKKGDELKRLLNETLEYDKLKTEFLSNVSHEFRTPLNVILGTLQLLETMDLAQNQDAIDIKKYRKTMKQNCFRLLRLVNNLIDITRLDSGFMQVDLENRDIIHMVEEMCMSVADFIKSKEIKFIFDTEMEEKTIACDPDMIERIILNILSNAVKFTPSGGSINVYISEQNGYVNISVKDTGIGIPEEKQEIIFDRFTQVDKTLTRSHEGSGIGLSLVRSLVELQGGNVTVQSEVDKGTEFVINLPDTLTQAPGNIKRVEYCKENDYVERIKVEFSDIYLE